MMYAARSCGPAGVNTTKGAATSVRPPAWSLSWRLPDGRLVPLAVLASAPIGVLRGLLQPVCGIVAGEQVLTSAGRLRDSRALVTARRFAEGSMMRAKMGLPLRLAKPVARTCR